MRRAAADAAEALPAFTASAMLRGHTSYAPQLAAAEAVLRPIEAAVGIIAVHLASNLPDDCDVANPDAAQAHAVDADAAPVCGPSAADGAAVRPDDGEVYIVTDC